MSAVDKKLRQRLIEAGQLRPNTKELDPIQIGPGSVVFRIEPTFSRLCEAASKRLTLAIGKGSSCWS